MRLELYCKACGAPAMRVIYALLPGWLCSDPECSRGGGPALTLAALFRHSHGNARQFKFVAYEGTYASAVWRELSAALTRMKRWRSG